MSSHREAPEISKDPVADNTDTYAFVSPDNPDTVTLIANFIPLQLPYGGPNFYEFGEEVLYEIHISNRGDAQADVTYQFRFDTSIRNNNTFLYNTGPITSITSPYWNRPQTYSVTVVGRNGPPSILATGLTVPPVNIGPRSTPNYDKTFTQQQLHTLPGGCKVFAGQRADAFFVDLGSIFDLGTLRPFEHLHLIPSADAVGVNGVQGLNVHTIAIQVHKKDITRNYNVPTDPMDAASVIGVWATASPPAVAHARRLRPVVVARPVDAGLATGQPAVQRGHRADGVEGPLEQPAAERGQPVREVRDHAGAGRAAARAVPEGVPEPGGLQEAAGRPGGDPADRHPDRRGQGLPELHRHHAGRHAAAQRRDSADGQARARSASSAATRPASRTGAG